MENENEEIIKNLKTFAERHGSTHSINVEDFKVSKNMSSGNGFTNASKGSVWNENRAKVAVNLLEPAVNSIVYKFTDSPFDFKTEAPIDLQELKFQLSSALRESVIDGLSYVLVYKENGRIRFSRLKNFNVIFDDCDYPSGKDAKEAVYIDKKKVPQQEYRRSKLGVQLQSVLNLKKYEIPVITYWVKDEKGVTTYKIENEEVVSKVTQEIDKIPIARIYAKEAYINLERNWRGLYHSVRGILRTVDFEMSLVQERIATAPNHKYWIAEESIGSDIEQYSRINDIPVSHKTYKALSSINPQVVLPPPARNDESTNLQDLLQAFGVHKDIISYILGTISGEERGSETAEAVLLRRESKDTAVNDLIKNLLDSSYLIGDIITQFTGFPVAISSDIFDKAKQSQDLEKIIALTSYVNNNPHAYSILPVLVSKLDVDETSKQTILALMSQEKEENQEAKLKIEALEAERKQLIANAESQLATAKMESESRIVAKQMDMIMKEKEIDLKNRELDIEEARIFKQETADHARTAADIAQKDAKLAMEGEKIANDSKAKFAEIMIEAKKTLNEHQPPTLTAGA